MMLRRAHPLIVFTMGVLTTTTFIYILWIHNVLPAKKYQTQPAHLTHIHSQKNDDSGTTKAKTTSVIAQALQQIRISTSNESNHVAACPTPVWVDSGQLSRGNKKFPCGDILPWKQDNAIRGPSLLRGCGNPYTIYTHPFGWECRLKERLELAIRSNGLSECAFGFLDIGTAVGDWVVALSGNSKSARFAAVEAHPKTFLEMLRNFHTNGLLHGKRVSPYPFAVGIMSDDRYDENNVNSITQAQQSEETEVSWPGSTHIKVSSWPGSTICMPTGLGNNGQFQTSGLSINHGGCKETETDVPIISVDMIMADWQVQGGGTTTQQVKDSNNNDVRLAFGGLFAVKVDIEGAERDAVKSAVKTFGDPQQRPCQLYFELKHGAEYAEALQQLVTLGYTEYIDVDSGKSGNTSFPPAGTLWTREGNYEFRLPTGEFEKCVDRIKRATCGPI